MRNLATTAFESGNEVATLDDQLRAIATRGHVDATEIKFAKLAAFEATVEHFLNDGELSEAEERHVTEVSRAMKLEEHLLDRNGAFTRLVRAGALREVMSGQPTTRLNVPALLPFNFQAKETLLWVFENVDYLEDRTKREYVGRSQGVSVRVMKGVYYRTGTFKGRPVDRVERTHIDTGLFAVTNKHLYFSGSLKSFRVRHDKIVSHMPFSDGLGIHRDAASAKPQVFITGDGWFTYNLIVNAANVA